MKNIKYPALEGDVRVWKDYSLFAKSSIYRFETCDPVELKCNSLSLDSMIDKLRDFRVNPTQIHNYASPRSKELELSEGQFERLISRVSRPKLFLIRLPKKLKDKPKIDEENFNVDLNRNFGVDIGIGGKPQRLPLAKLPNMLNECGVRPSDLVFLKPSRPGYIRLDEQNNYRLYVLTSLDRTK